jgi:Probable zinc-ribbon domain
VTYRDKYIRCIVCGTTFAFSAAEQELLASKGSTNVPKLCRPCRDVKDAQIYGGGERGQYHRILALTHLPKA